MYMFEHHVIARMMCSMIIHDLEVKIRLWMLDLVMHHRTMSL